MPVKTQRINLLMTSSRNKHRWLRPWYWAILVIPFLGPVTTAWGQRLVNIKNIAGDISPESIAPLKPVLLQETVPATAHDVVGNDYYGPNGPGEQRGKDTKRVPRTAAASNAADAKRLWAISEELTGVTYPWPHD